MRWHVEMWPLYRSAPFMVCAEHGGAYGGNWMNPGARGWKWFKTYEAAQAFADKLNRA